METSKTIDETEVEIEVEETLESLLEQVQARRNEFLEANFAEHKDFLEEVANGKGALVISLGRLMARYILSELEVSQLHSDDTSEEQDDK